MKTSFLFQFLLLAANVFSQGIFELNPEKIAHEKYRAKKLQFIGADSNSYFVLAGKLTRGDHDQVQKFDKKSNKLVYSKPIMGLEENFIAILDDNSLYLINDKYEDKKWTVNCKKVEKSTGTSGELIAIASFDSPKEGINSLNYSYYSGNKILVSYQNTESKKPQELKLVLFDLAKMRAEYSRDIPPEINEKKVFTDNLFLSPDGKVIFTYYFVKDQQELERFRNIRHAQRLIKAYERIHNSYRQMQLTEFLPQQNPSVGILGIDGQIKTIAVNPPETFFIDPYNINVEFFNEKIIIHGMVKETWKQPISKCDLGFFTLTINPDAGKIEQEVYELSNSEVLTKLNMPSLGWDFSGIKTYRTLNTIVDNGSIYSLYQYYVGLRQEKTLVAGKYSVSNGRYEWLKVIPYCLQDPGLYYGLNLSVNTFVYNDDLYLIHLDHPSNYKIEEANPMTVPTFALKEANLVLIRIGKNGTATKSNIFSNSSDEFACPSTTNILLDRNKIVLFSRGGDENGGYDRYSTVEVK